MGWAMSARAARQAYKIIVRDWRIQRACRARTSFVRTGCAEPQRAACAAAAPVVRVMLAHEIGLQNSFIQVLRPPGQSGCSRGYCRNACQRCDGVNGQQRTQCGLRLGSRISSCGGCGEAQTRGSSKG